MTAILLMPDKHMAHHKMSIPGSDVLIKACDDTNKGTKRVLLDFFSWFGRPPILFVFFALTIAACGKHSRQTEHVIGDIVTVSGSLNVSNLNASTKQNIKVYVIDLNDRRQILSDAEVDSDGSFSLRVPLRFLQSSLLNSEALSWFKMGRTLSSSSAASAIRDKVEGYLRLEFILDESPHTSGEILYKQILLPVRKHDLWAGSSIRLYKQGDVIVLNTVRKLAVTTKDSSGQPLSDVKTVSFPYVDTESLSPSDYQDYLPVASISNEQGQMLIYPIQSKGLNPQFQIVAAKDGYCPYASEGMSLSDKSGTPVTITLEDCESLTEFTVDFSPLIRRETIGDGSEGRNIGYLNSDDVHVLFKLPDASFAGMTVYVFEGEDTQGKLFSQKHYSSFQSERRIEIPRAFQDGTTPNGRFVIVIESDQMPGTLKLLYGDKSKSTPVLDAASITFKSTEKQPAVISGRHGQSFVLDNPDCPRLGAMGVSYGASSYQFVDCNDSGLLIFTNLQAISSTGLGGERELRVVAKDRYGNISDVIKKTVYVDFGIPDLASQPVSLGVEIGIVPVGTPQASDDSPSNFVAATVIKKSEIDQKIMRFRSPSSCFHSLPSAADGSANPGTKISSFGVSNSSSPITGSFVSCSESLNLAERVSFPSDVSAPAIFYLTIIDAAGHKSSPFAFEIPACQGQPDLYFYCWE